MKNVRDPVSKYVLIPRISLSSYKRVAGKKVACTKRLNQNTLVHMLDKKYTIAIGFTTWYVLFNIMYFTGTAQEKPCEKTPLL